MNNTDKMILEQLYKGNHLNLKERQRAKELLTMLQAELETRK